MDLTSKLVGRQFTPQLGPPISRTYSPQARRRQGDTEMYDQELIPAWRKNAMLDCYSFKGIIAGAVELFIKRTNCDLAFH